MPLAVSVQAGEATGGEGGSFRLDALAEGAAPGEAKFRAEAAGGRVVFRGTISTRDAESIRSAAASVVDEASRLELEQVSVAIPPLAELDLEQFFIGLHLAGYRFDQYRQASKPEHPCPASVLVETAVDASGALARALAISSAVALARDLVNEPPSVMTPSRFAEIAGSVAASSGLQIRVWDEEECRRERLGGLLGVAAGSVQPPRVVKASYVPGGAKERVALVGKGITFDSGGLSLKQPGSMMTMKTDMSGAAAVLAALSALPALGLGVEVHGYMMLTENLPSGSAQKPGDVLITRSGKTIEVLNTDAEGRLVLADGLTLAVEEGCGTVVDIATLTGACVVALGDEVAGVMGNDEALVEALREAGTKAAEPCWPLPLPERYESDIKSEIADMKNIGKAGSAGAITAGLLLQRFVSGARWAHLDVAGPARAESNRGWIRQGGTGFGVMTFLSWLAGL